MQPELPPSNGAPRGGALPPVEPPSAKFILQLFLVPGILVAVIVGFIWIFFGWIGGGPSTPEEFLSGLKSHSELKRWKTAQELAQVLPRKKELRGNVPFALDIAELLESGMKNPAPKPAEGDSNKEAPDLLEFLPAAVGTFHVPVGLPLLQKLVEDNLDKIEELPKDPKDAQKTVRVNGEGLRLRNAVVAIGILGARMREYDELSPADKARIHEVLQREADAQRREGVSPNSSHWAQLALAYLTNRDRRKGAISLSDASELAARAIAVFPVLPNVPAMGVAAAVAGLEPHRVPVDTFQVIDTLAKAAASKDELTRKFAIVALANWDEPRSDAVLAALRGIDGVTIFENDDHARALAEIRYNAVLALARRASPLTDWDLVLETLDLEHLRSPGMVYEKNPGGADILVTKALRDLAEWKRVDPEGLHKQPRIKEAVDQLAAGKTPAIAIEARKLLGEQVAPTSLASRLSRETVLIIGVGVSVLLLLALAVIARWRRRPA